MHATKRLWWTLAIVFTVSFAFLGQLGREIYQVAPPIPEAVKIAGTETPLYTATDINEGQNVWQSMGGQENGTIWGHGSYLPPDWSADWLHREAVALLDIYAIKSGAASYDSLSAEAQAALRERLKTEMRTNSYDKTTGTLTVSAERAEAIQQVASYYQSLFGDDDATHATRVAYAMKDNPIPDEARRHQMGAFIFWTAWATTTERPGKDITYTSNWPHEELVGNHPTSSMLLWTMFSVLAMLGGVGLLTWYHAVQTAKEEPFKLAGNDPLAGVVPTKSMRATFKFFAIVAALFLTQILLGAVTAHFAVEGHDFYGIPLAKYLPYTVTRTWHIQLAVFWIATAWLGTGLFIGPMISGKEPKFQTFGVNFLFLAALIIVVGSMFGEWAGVQQWFGNTINFWFGHQGYEYIDLGRFWQIFLFVGLMLWVGLVTRAIWPALKNRDESRPLYIMLLLSALSIGLFYGAGLMWGQHTHISVVEYWRWWVVHLWVEGFFEVFATLAIAFLFVKLGLVSIRSATHAVVFATIIFLTGGILGTAHHWYFSGTPLATIAYGAMFSALEVVPLVLVGFEAYGNYRMSQSSTWLARYRWPIMFFVAVAFWNMLGAGLFGFLINPPMTLYYTQGLNTTPTHGHSALFGVYGMLALGLMLFCLRLMSNPKAWDDRLLKWAFWSLNIGLFMMVTMSLLPVGILQTIASVEQGMWYARSAEFMQQPLIHQLVWMRVPGDIVFALGGFLIALFTAKLWLYRKA